jgi:hypothetical protein
MIKRFLVFKKDKESLTDVGKLLQICPTFLEMKQLSLQAQNMTNKKEELESFKIEQTHFVSSLYMTLVF